MGKGVRYKRKGSLDLHSIRNRNKVYKLGNDMNISVF